MAMSVTYTNFLGGIAAEMRGGVGSYYVSDTLGSTAALVNATGTVTDTWAYWPYGEVQSRTGTTVTPFTFVGILGYFQDLLNNFTYVRARHFRVQLARWQTLDPLWPSQPASVYAGNAPNTNVDPSGLVPGSHGGDFGGNCNGFPNCQAALACCLQPIGGFATFLSAFCGGSSAIALAICLKVCVTTGVETAGFSCLVCLGTLAYLLGCLYVAWLFYNSKIDNCNLAYGQCIGTIPCPKPPPHPPHQGGGGSGGSGGCEGCGGFPGKRGTGGPVWN